MIDAKGFTTGGTISGKGIYIRRPADNQLLELCKGGSFAYVLTSRQMGKSSLMARISIILRESGYTTAIIDLNRIGVDEQPTADQWYQSVLNIMLRSLQLEVNLSAWWLTNNYLTLTDRFVNFISDCILPQIETRLVIFVDEIDSTIPLSFTDDFFAAIRYFHNTRALTPEYERLSFVLLGAAAPGDLISDPVRTPFNIGYAVHLSDFTFDEALPFAELLLLEQSESEQVLRWVLGWTGGHPFLTQRLCAKVREQRRKYWTEEEIEHLVEDVFFGVEGEKDHNLAFVRNMLLQSLPKGLTRNDVLATYKEIYESVYPVLDDEQSLIKSHLKLAGIVKVEAEVLFVRNRIYSRVFNRAWLDEYLAPSILVEDIHSTTRNGILVAVVVSVVLVLIFAAIFLTLQSSNPLLSRVIIFTLLPIFFALLIILLLLWRYQPFRRLVGLSIPMRTTIVRIRTDVVGDTRTQRKNISLASESTKPATVYAYLIIEEGVGSDEKLLIPINRVEFLVGRVLEAGCDAVLPNKTVSARHFIIEYRGSVFRINDLGSANGTSLNGKRIIPGEAQPLKDGAIIELGNRVRLRFYEGKTPPTNITRYNPLSSINSGMQSSGSLGMWSTPDKIE